MRVLMISKACIVGAYQTKLEEIARHSDMELQVAVPPSWRQEGRAIPLERAHTTGYDLVVEPVAFNGNFHLHYYPRLGRRMRLFRPDIVHIDEEPYNWATCHALMQARRVGARALWFSWQNIERRYPLPFQLIERYTMSHADYALAGSASAAEVWRHKGYAGPLAVIPQFGVAPDLYQPRDDPRDPARGFVIGYAGRLVPEKGVDVLLEAVARITTPCRLLIAGSGPEQEHLEALARARGVADRVSFESHLPSSRMPAFYRELDVLVLPSRSRPNWVEQFGRALVEAMACGVAVIGSDCGEIPAVIGDAGLVFPEGDVDALHACLNQLAHSPQRCSELGQRGRQRVMANFTQAHIAAQTVAVYREMMGAARG